MSFRKSHLIRRGELCLHAWSRAFILATDMREGRRATEFRNGRAMALGKIEYVWQCTGTNSEAVPTNSVHHWSLPSCPIIWTHIFFSWFFCAFLDILIVYFSAGQTVELIAVMEMLCICAIQYGSHQLWVAVEPLTCG